MPVKIKLDSIFRILCSISCPRMYTSQYSSTSQLRPVLIRLRTLYSQNWTSVVKECLVHPWAGKQ